VTFVFDIVFCIVQSSQLAARVIISIPWAVRLCWLESAYSHPLFGVFGRRFLPVK